jgi:hypothetical protein
MATEVLARQAGARAKLTGQSLEEALRGVLQTEAGRRLGQLRDGPRDHVVRVSSLSVRRRGGWAASTLCLDAAQALVYLHPTRFTYACFVACGSCDPSGPFVAGTLPCLEPLARA